MIQRWASPGLSALVWSLLLLLVACTESAPTPTPGLTSTFAPGEATALVKTYLRESTRPGRDSGSCERYLIRGLADVTYTGEELVGTNTWLVKAERVERVRGTRKEVRDGEVFVVEEEGVVTTGYLEWIVYEVSETVEPDEANLYGC